MVHVAPVHISDNSSQLVNLLVLVAQMFFFYIFLHDFQTAPNPLFLLARPFLLFHIVGLIRSHY